MLGVKGSVERELRDRGMLFILANFFFFFSRALAAGGGFMYRSKPLIYSGPSGGGAT